MSELNNRNREVTITARQNEELKACAQKQEKIIEELKQN